MNVTPIGIEGPLIIDPKVFGDERGFFQICWNEEMYRAAGIGYHFVQDNLSRSTKGVLRGLHFQWRHPQGKLVSVLEGEVYDVAVDLRIGSPTYGESEGVVLSAANHRQFFVPPGFAHGFQVTSPYALFSYKVTDRYDPQAEESLLWNDPTLKNDLPLAEPTLSEKDRVGTPLAELDTSRLLRYEG